MNQSILSLETQVKNLIIKYLCFVILVIVLYPTVHSQSLIIDSLENEISITTSASDSSVIMNELSKRLSDYDPSKAMVYAKNALDISKRIQNKEQEISAMFNIGVLYYDSFKERSNSLSYFKHGEEEARKNGFKKLQANHLMRLANYYRYHEIDSAKTVTYLFQSLNVSKDDNYDYGTARSFAKLASFYTKHRELDLCSEYLDSAAVYYLKIPYGLNNIVHYYVEVGNKIWDYDPKTSMDIYWEAQKYSDINPDPKISLANAHILLNEPEKAIEYLRDALPHLNNSQYPRKKGIALAKLAEAYFLIRDYEAASETCQTGIDHLESTSVTSQSGLPSLYRTKANLFDLKNKSAEAIHNYNISIEKGYNINELSEVHKSNLALGNFYVNRDLDKAIKYCDKALKGSQERNLVNLEIESYDCLFRIHKNLNNPSEALYNFEQKFKLLDSVSTIKIQHALEINDIKTENDKKIALESIKAQMKEEQLKSQTKISGILMISSVVGFILIGLLLLGIRKIKRQNIDIKNNTEDLIKANKDLERSNNDLERFAYIASHDLKSPINIMVSFAALLKRKLKSINDEESMEYLSFIEKSGKRMRKLIEDILVYSKLSSKSSSKHEIINLNDVVNEIAALVNNKYEGKPINIAASSLPNLKWNYTKIFLLFKNLIENGLKYNDSDIPQVKLQAIPLDKYTMIQIEDNGIGIPDKYFDEIFEMFNRLHGTDKYEGTGIGLATCKKIIEELGGEISVSSTMNKGSRFEIRISNELIVQK